MWVFTQEGFFSAVEHRNRRDCVIVRCRAHSDMKALHRRFPSSELVVGGGTDYAYRMVLPKKLWARYLAEQAKGIDYDNFKNRVTQRQGSWRHDVYMRVWSTMLSAFSPKDRWYNERPMWSPPVTRQTSMFASRAAAYVGEVEQYGSGGEIFETIPGTSECCTSGIVIVDGSPTCEECGGDPYM